MTGPFKNEAFKRCRMGLDRLKSNVKGDVGPEDTRKKLHNVFALLWPDGKYGLI
ncbi:MAG: hypothetical protein ACI9IV_000775 [Paracoccaceae bacterium]|jgi:hypothetical protein|tara:strand:+ start:598 stop:759 length:162 start_codon:yes stop_codon:yes gene_type:complete